MKIWTVDAFAKHSYTGNPAGVMIVEEFPKNCQQIAFEVNLSETAFVKPLGGNHFHIRWFTPTIEVPLCGHGTLAAAHILCQEKRVMGAEIVFDSLSGPLRVTVNAPEYILDFPLQKIGKKVVVRSNFGTFVNAVEVQGDVLVELASEREVREYVPKINDILEEDFQGVILTARGEWKYDFVSRFFCPKEGINEDPVTGSIHCRLAHYWGEKTGKSEFLAYQASPRGGEIRIKIVGDRVHLTGTAVTMLKGEWLGAIS